MVRAARRKIGRVQESIEQNYCRDCVHSEPDMSNMSFTTGRPILCSCKFQPFMMLLSHDRCENFQRR